MTDRLALTLLLFLVACPAEEPPAEEEPTPVPCNDGLPPPSAGCLPECGNELQVGQPCTDGGGENVVHRVGWVLSWAENRMTNTSKNTKLLLFL